MEPDRDLLLQTTARLEILEVAFLNLLSFSEPEVREAFARLFQDMGEEAIMAGEPDDYRRRQHLAAVRLGRRIEERLAKTRRPE